MQKINHFKFSSIQWANNVSIFGYKMRLEKLNGRKQIGVKCLESYRNYKIMRFKLSQMKIFNKSTLLLKSIIVVEIASLIYFKLLRLSTNSKFFNETYNHEKTFDYFLNIFLYRRLGTILSFLNPIKFNLLLAISLFSLTPLISLLNEKLTSFVNENYQIENFSLYTENNILAKIVLCSALVKFLAYFISDKFWNLKYFKFNRKHIFILLSTFLLMRITSFVSLFTSDTVK